MIFAFGAALVVVLWCGWTLNCLGFHDWDSRRGDFTDTCKRCGRKRFK
jgi:hypothetical protein